MIVTLVKVANMCLVLTICMSVSLGIEDTKSSSAYKGLLTKTAKSGVTHKREVEVEIKVLQRRNF